MKIFRVQKEQNSVSVNLQIVINIGIYKYCMQIYAAGSSAGCRL